MDAQRPDETIIAELVELGKTDTTEPKPGDRDAWILDLTLRKLEGATLQMGQGQRFADICGAVRRHSADPHVRGLMLLGMLNYYRRPGSLDITATEAIVEQANKEFTALTPCPRTKRLVEFLTYQVGIFAGEQGHFQLAAETQTNAAKYAEANGNVTGAVICRYMAAYEALRQGIVNGDDTTDNLAYMLYEQRDELAENVPKGAPEQRWDLLNTAIDMLVVFYWLDKQYENWASEMLKVARFETCYPEVAKDNAGAIAVAKATIYRQAKFQTNHDDAMAIAEHVITNPGNTPPDYVATAHLILARLAAEFGSTVLERHHLEAIIALPTGAHAVKAIATRALAKLTAN